MKKNNSSAAGTKKMIKHDLKNKARKKRSTELKRFNNLVAYFKWLDNMKKIQEEQRPALLEKGGTE